MLEEELNEKINYNEWYNSCEFVENYLQFYSYNDFVDKAKEIKIIFDKANYKAKKLYRYYIFACRISYSQKCLIWNYLNDYKEYTDLMIYRKK